MSVLSLPTISPLYSLVFDVYRPFGSDNLVFEKESASGSRNIVIAPGGLSGTGRMIIAADNPTIAPQEFPPRDLLITTISNYTNIR